MSTRLPEPSERRISRWAVVRFALFVLVIVGLGLALRWTPLARYADQEVLVGALTSLQESLSRTWWAPPALVALYGILCPLGLPISLLWIAGGIVFGVGWGTVYNLLGTMVGAVASYYFARGLGHDFVTHLAGDRLVRVEKALNRHGFWTLARSRFLPIPFPIFNYAAALVGIRPSLFFASSAAGLLLPVIIWTYFWHTAYSAAAGNSAAHPLKVILALGLFFLLTFLPRLWTGLRRRRRLQQLRQLRRSR